MHLSQILRLRACLMLVLLAGLPACQVTDIPLWGPEGPPPVDGCEVERIRNVAYYDGPDACPRHRADIYLPKGLTNFPVVVLVHGGTWVMGDNRLCGLQSSSGEFLARHGIGAVLPNYRLSPKVRHPEHVKDVARAFAWTHAHIAKYGGDPNRMFLAGHSAGGHLVSLLATDEQYLKAEGLTTSDVKGVISISGVYSIPPGSQDVMLGGGAPCSVRLGQMAPLRGKPWPNLAKRLGLPGIPLRVNVFGVSFGDDELVRADASPINHVRPGLPPFLIFYAEDDLPLLPEMAAEFHETLLKAGGESTLLRIANRNHNSIMFRASREKDAVARAMLKFVSRHAGTSNE